MASNEVLKSREIEKPPLEKPGSQLGYEVATNPTEEYEIRKLTLENAKKEYDLNDIS